MSTEIKPRGRYFEDFVVGEEIILPCTDHHFYGYCQFCMPYRRLQ
jgi:hypothetical protein